MVVGAGLSGLVAAREVARAGRSVAVLEARNRVGGRMLSRTVAGGPEVVDLGAEFIGPTQNHIAALVRELGIGHVSVVRAGRQRLRGRREAHDVRRRRPHRPGAARPRGPARPAADGVGARLDGAAGPGRRAVEGGARGRVGQPVARVVDSAPTRRTAAASATQSTAAIRAIFAAEPREISLLFALFFIAASGDERNPGTFERNFSTRNGAQQDRIAGGTQAIALALARQLGRRVVRRSPVRRIVVGRGYVDVISDRYVNRARRVIVALPPTLAGRIQYEPSLPALRDGLTQRLPQGHMVKVQAVYERPFWRADGLTGASVADVGPLNITFDSSPESGVARRAARLRGRRRGPAVRGAARGRAARGRAGRLRPRVRPGGAIADRLRRDELVAGDVVARLPGRRRAAGRADVLRHARCASRSAGSTGRAPRPRRTGTATWTAR